MAEESAVYVKVMTDEQMEVLRHQISVYATICDQLVELHKSITAHQDSISGMRMGNIYNDPLMTSGSHKISARPRWTPTPTQLQILENIFDQGHGTPNKEKIKEISVELSQHGPISETNVYNWFQNRRARSKRKQQVSAPNSNNAESDVETEVEYLLEEKAKTKSLSPAENFASNSDDLCFHNREISSKFHSLESQTGMDPQFMGKQDFQGNFDPFQDGFNMIG